MCAPDAAFFGFGEETFEVIIGAITRGNLVIICHIIAGVVEGGHETGVNPDGIHAEGLNVVQLFGDPWQVANAVVIGVIKGLGINLIEDCFFQPSGGIGFGHISLLICD